MTRVAVIGCGYWGKNLVRNFYELGALGAISDASEVQALEISRQFNNIPILSFEQIAASSDIQGVVIASPAALHAQHVRYFLEANKHVFVEKPLALDINHAKDLGELAKQKGRTLMVGHLLQYHPAYLKLKELVAENTLGNLRYVYSNRLSTGKIRSEENVWWSFAPHDISMILGLVKSPLAQVQASSSTFVTPNISDFTTTHFIFENGVKAHVFVSWLHPFKEQKLVVVGDKAMAVFDDCESWPNKLTVYHHDLDVSGKVPVIQKGLGQSIEIEVQEPLRQECEHFLACIKGQIQPRTDAQEGIRVLEVLSLAEESLKKSQPIHCQKTSSHYFKHESAYVDEHVSIGEGTKIWHFSHILGHVEIGQNVIVGQNVMIGPNVKIGNNCKIQNNVSLYKGITLEDGVFCGPSCVFTNVNNPRAEIERKDEFRPTLVQRGSTIGANATIVCGVTLGAYCFIGAGATVTKDVPAHALMVGVPARQIGWVSHSGEKLGDDLVCPRDGTSYEIVNGELQTKQNLKEVG